METSFLPIITPAFCFSAGLALYTAIHSLISVSNKDRISLNLALAVLSLFITGIQISTAAYYQAMSVVQASVSLKFQLIFFLGFVLSAYAFIGIYTDYPRVTPILIPSALFFGALLPLNFYSPHSLRFTTLVAAEPIRMPWGETLMIFTGATSIWNWAFRIIHFSLICFFGWRAIALFRQGKRSPAILLGLSTVLFLLAAIWGVLIDLDRVHSIYPGGFVFVFLMIMMSISLAQDRKKDLSDLRHAADLIRRGEMELSSIFKAAPVAVGLVKDRTLVKVNDFMCEMMGYAREELIGQSLRMFYQNEKEFERVGREFYTSIKKKGVSTIETECCLKDGRVINALIKGAFLNPDDESAGFVTMALDITDRKALEKQSPEQEKLESLGLLAGGIAHDFNNILTAIVGNISLAKVKVDIKNPIYRLLGEAEKASFRARGLSSQLLTFSKGGQPVKHTASIKDLLNDSVEFVLRGSNVRAKLEISEQL